MKALPNIPNFAPELDKINKYLADAEALLLSSGCLFPVDVEPLSWGRNEHGKFRIMLAGQPLAERRIEDRLASIGLVHDLVEAAAIEATCRMDEFRRKWQ